MTDTEAAYLRMTTARRAFLDAWLTWVETRPTVADLDDEYEGTRDAVRGIAELAGVGR